MRRSRRSLRLSQRRNARRDKTGDHRSDSTCRRVCTLRLCLRATGRFSKDRNPHPVGHLLLSCLLSYRRSPHLGTLGLQSRTFPPPGEGDTSDPVLATRQRLSLMPGEARSGETHLHSSPSPFAFPFLHKRRKEAERRQTQVTNRRILRMRRAPFRSAHA